MSLTATPPTQHGLAAGAAPACVDWTIRQGWHGYGAIDPAVGKALYDRQTRLLPGRARAQFIAGMQALPMRADRIPDFEPLSEMLMRHIGGPVVAVPGLAPDEVFFEHLGHRRFPAGQFVRRGDPLDHPEAPDDLHDLFGHEAMRRCADADEPAAQPPSAGPQHRRPPCQGLIG